MGILTKGRVDMAKRVFVLILLSILVGCATQATVPKIPMEKVSNVESHSYSNFESMEKVSNVKADHIIFGYNRFKAIEKFAPVNISLLGSAEKIGLNEDELADYLMLRFKNSYPGIEFKKPTAEDIIKGELGYITVRVWTIGDDNPIACYIQIIAGISSRDGELYQNELLGYDSRKTIHGSVKETISKLVDGFATSFFKARGEL